MKTQTSPFILIPLSGLVLLAGVFALAGCASTQPALLGQTLASAGFRLRTPETPKQKEIYASLPAYKVHRINVNGQTFYVYKDEAKGIAFVGREAEYQRYRELAIQQRIAQEYYMAVEMDRMYAPGWYGAWGPSRIYW